MEHQSTVGKNGNGEERELNGKEDARERQDHA